MPLTAISTPEAFNEAIKGSPIVVIKFFATWCMPCKGYAPTVEKMATTYPGAKFYEVDIDDLPTVFEEYKGTSIPSLHIFKDGSKVKQIDGVKPKLVEETLNELCGSPTGNDTSASAPVSIQDVQGPLIENVAQLRAFTSRNPFVTIKVYADWCQPCRGVNPHWEKWVANPEYKSVAFARVNIDQDAELAELFAADALPTFKFFVETKDVATLESGDPAVIQGYVEKFVKKALKAAGASAPAPGPAPAGASVPASDPAPTPAPSSAPASAAAPAPASGVSADSATGSKTGLVPSVGHLPFVTPFSRFQAAINEHPYTAVCFVTPAGETAAQTQMRDVMSVVSDAIAQVYVNPEKDVQIADCYGVVSNRCPVFKLIHKGIHFATLYQPSNEVLATKLRELLSL